MITREEHARLSQRLQYARFWVETIANLELADDCDEIVLIYWEVQEIAKVIHPEVLV